MNPQPRSLPVALCGAFVLIAALGSSVDWTPKPVKQDRLVRMPGTQPGQGVNLEGPDRCLNCHGDYDPAVEPGFNWKGSMMAQAARDPLFLAAMTSAAQDSIWALGNPNATDLCLRCHFPEGWLEGRSDPTNGSLMVNSDHDGVHCDFCHSLYDPFAKTTFAGTREGADWSGYWDEYQNTGPGSKTLSQTSAQATLVEDLSLQSGVKMFSGDSFFLNEMPRYASYRENSSGQFFVSTSPQKRAGFADVAARHKTLYSRYHKSKYFCATCHDVSNPALANLLKPLPDQSAGKHQISEQYTASKFYHLERTFSEFMLSSYGRQGGAATSAAFQQQGMATISWAATCQDCHMRDVIGKGADKNGVPLRPGGSTEHPRSGQPLHDLSGGNSWITHILASLDPNGPVYDPRNAQILGKGASVLTLDLSAGESPVKNGAALAAGSRRAVVQLKVAATIRDLVYDSSNGQLSFRVQNNTGHKLISGFPEGRRMFVNIKVLDVAGRILEQINPYDHTVGTLRGLPGVKSSPPLRVGERYVDALVYEMHGKSDLTKELKTFHMPLVTGRSKDNRIPPRGFDVLGAVDRLCEPVWQNKSAPAYFSAAEYAGGYDEVRMSILPQAARVIVSLFYQGTSREYVEFLRDEINGTGTTLPPSAYIAQTDPFFARLKAWGDTIWDLWYHNHGLDSSGHLVPGIVPVEMTRAEFSGAMPHLYHTGNATPGGSIQIVVHGRPSAAVLWALSGDPSVFSPPITIAGITGLFFLRPPMFVFSLGPIGADGRLTLPLRLPPTTPPSLSLPTQVLVDSRLSNLDVVRISR